jgi:hypothetical protein
MELYDSIPIELDRITGDEHIMELYNSRSLFDEAPRSKAHNDEDNKKREDIIRDLFSPEKQIRDQYLDHSSNGHYWKSIRDGFDRALKTFRSPPASQVPGAYISTLEKAGGRNNRFDYLAKTLWADDSSGLKLEFKRGTSIFDQPQFLSLYAKRGTLTNADVASYPEFLFENFGSELEKISGVKMPAKDYYVKYVFGTKPKPNTIFQDLYNASKKGLREPLLNLQYRSINDYLVFLRNIKDFPTSDSFQAELTNQREKLFVSWDTSTQNFHVEQFSVDDMTVKGDASLKAGKNGFNVVEFENLAGNKIEALLRWRNGPCVLNPAWQIKLSVSSIK